MPWVIIVSIHSIILMRFYENAIPNFRFNLQTAQRQEGREAMNMLDLIRRMSLHKDLSSLISRAGTLHDSLERSVKVILFIEFSSLIHSTLVKDQRRKKWVCDLEYGSERVVAHLECRCCNSNPSLEQNDGWWRQDRCKRVISSSQRDDVITKFFSYKIIKF